MKIDSGKKRESKEKRTLRISKSRDRAKEWANRRIEKAQQKRLSSNHIAVAERLVNNYEDCEPIILSTIELCDSEHLTADLSALKDYSRSVIQDLQRERAFLLQQVEQIDQAINLVAKTCR